MTVIQAIVLGIVQGLSEFLPISSSGHLILVPVVFGWDVQAQSFDIVLHVATLVAVLFFFRARVVRIGRALIDFRNPTIDRTIGLAVIIATIPAALVGLLFGDKIESMFRSPQSVAISLIIGACILFVADRYIHRRHETHPISKVSFRNAIVVGCAQVLAFVPGMSRSGVTISAALFQNFSKTAAAEFSFLMSIPIIVLAGMSALKDIIGVGGISHSVPSLIAGFIAAVISGLVSIWLTLTVIRKVSFIPFVIYRIMIGVIILILFI
ncbi:MAG TPA: undecaprenyl-diphosphatase UppP [Candidatus Magasanikbacteria bacterium]|nr:undecaprenyl-diphosphatase UppP [Candidatus Magasanikbacteria bacterium]